MYIVPFVIRPIAGSYYEHLKDRCRIAIELDGHDFHERTREQVIHRNKRDRDLQADGWLVWHVSGSEFNSSPESVVREIYDRASNLFWTTHNKARRPE
jgi:very-short-patch-repair endonuclease